MGTLVFILEKKKQTLIQKIIYPGWAKYLKKKSKNNSKTIQKMDNNF